MRVLVLVFLCAGFLAPRLARAQKPAPSGEDAQLLFDEGLKYMLEGELKVGCAFIKQSLDVDPRPGTIFTLAECYARAGKFASAVEYYDEYLNVFTRLPNEEQERQRARADVSHKERSRLVKSVPWITVVLPEDSPDGVVVTMDDEPFPASLFGVAIAVDPGKHWFTARAPGGPLARSELTVKPGDRRTHVLDLYASPAGGKVDEPDIPPDDAIGSDDGKGGGISPLVYVFGGIGVAGAATATVTGIMLINLAGDIHDQCDDGDAQRCGPRGDADAQQAIDDAELAQNTLGPINTISLAVGAAGIGAAVLLLLTDSSSDASNGDVSASATLGPERAGLSISGRF